MYQWKKCPNEILRMRGMCILRMFEDTFSLGTAYKNKIMFIHFFQMTILQLYVLNLLQE